VQRLLPLQEAILYSYRKPTNISNVISWRLTRQNEKRESVFGGGGGVERYYILWLERQKFSLFEGAQKVKQWEVNKG
jgi:hypothetical protein